MRCYRVGVVCTSYGRGEVGVGVDVDVGVDWILVCDII